MKHSHSSRNQQTQSHKWLTAGLVAGAVVAVAGLGHAWITNTFGAVVQIAPPPSVMPGDLEGPDILAFDEIQNLVLTVDLPVDATPVNTVQAETDLNPRVIPQGTCVSSHYIHYDPEQTASATGGVMFDQQVLGVAVLQSTLDATNGLGTPFTTYPEAADCGGVGAPVHCGLELSPDRIQVGNNGVRVDFLAADPGDRVRVITRGCCEPECCERSD